MFYFLGLIAPCYRQEVLTLDNEIASNDVVIEERDQGIREINYDVEQVNEIYKDLAILLLDQQATIGMIRISY